MWTHTQYDQDGQALALGSWPTTLSEVSQLRGRKVSDPLRF